MSRKEKAAYGRHTAITVGAINPEDGAPVKVMNYRLILSVRSA
jgi:hypothetical protein